MNNLPPISDESFDGEKFSVEVKTEKCQHDVVLIDPTHLKCKKCSAGWSGPQIGRLYEAFKKQR